MKELRQSDGWINYLKWLGWTCSKTSHGTNISIRKIPFGAVAKIQRPKNLKSEELLEIEKICRASNALFVKIEPSLDQDLKTLDNQDYKASRHPLLPPTTIYVDLTKTEKELKESVSKSGKYSINRAEREGAKIEIYQQPQREQLEMFFELTQQTAKARKFLYSSVKDLEKKVELFGKNSYLIFSKDPSGKNMVANFYLGVDNAVWFFHGGTSHEGRKGKWGYALVWESFLYFKKQGYTILDLEGVDDERFPTFTKTWGGFSHFKEKFGGQRIMFPEPYIKILSPGLKILEKFYKKLPL